MCKCNSPSPTHTRHTQPRREREREREMAAQRSHVLLLCCLVILLATHEVQGLFECLNGCPSRCQKEFHETLYVCAIYCGMKCTCNSGGVCDYIGMTNTALDSDNQDQDLKLLAAAKARAAAQPSPVSTKGVH